MKFIKAFLLAVCVGLTPLALAADKHGGHEVEVGNYHVELVVKGRDLTVYVRDAADKPIPVSNVKASANLLSGQDKRTVKLDPAGEALKGTSPFDLAKDAKVVVSFKVGEGKTEQARFSLGQKQDHKGHKH